MVSGRPNGELDAWFRSLMVTFSSVKGQAGSGGPVPTLSGWKDLPMELLVRIISTVGDDRMVIVASGVCTGWRDALGWGVTNLSLTWCKQSMNNLMISLAHKFTKLQVLTLRQNKPQLEDSAVEAVANYCHDLRELDLSRSFGLSDRSLYALAHGCPRLTRLNISGCSNFSDTALIYLTCRCKNLKCLNLCGCVKAATDRALQVIAQNCGQLQSLNLGWCDDVTDKGVTSLASGCPDLRAVDLCGCVLITDESVVALANGCPHLRSLGLYYCQNITDRAMYSLANSRAISMSVEIPMDQPAASTPLPAGAVCDVVDGDEAALPPANARPTRVLISPIVPLPADGGASADAAALPPAYTGVLYLHRHKWPAVEDDPGKKREKWLKEMRGWLMVLAVLAASVTYQAGLNPPGGFWQQDDAQGNVAGTPVLQSKFPKRSSEIRSLQMLSNHCRAQLTKRTNGCRYTVFFYFNSTAFVTSVVIIVLLMNESFYHSEAKVEALEIIVVLDMAGLMGAYIAGCTREVSSSIYIIVLTLVVFLYVLYTAQFLPKLWGLVVDVPFLHRAAQGGALPVPQNILDGARPRTDIIGRTKSAPLR